MERLSDALATAQEQYALDGQAAAEAEADYKVAHARTLVGFANGSRKIPLATQEAYAIVGAEEEFRLWKITEAQRQSTGRALDSYKARLEAMRTEAASRRNDR